MSVNLAIEKSEIMEGLELLIDKIRLMQAYPNTKIEHKLLGYLRSVVDSYMQLDEQDQLRQDRRYSGAVDHLKSLDGHVRGDSVLSKDDVVNIIEVMLERDVQVQRAIRIAEIKARKRVEYGKDEKEAIRVEKDELDDYRSAIGLLHTFKNNFEVRRKFDHIMAIVNAAYNRIHMYYMHQQEATLISKVV